MRVFCNLCSRETHHKILAEHKDEYEDVIEERYTYSEFHTYRIAKCLGCKSTSFLHDEIGDHTSGENYQEVFPARKIRQEPKWQNKLMLAAVFNKAHVSNYLKEIYAAIWGRHFRLATMGIRSLIEHMMIDICANDSGSFKKNLDAFQTEGYISGNQKESLMKVIEMGHAVTHRGFSPDPEDVYMVLDVIEPIIQQLYVNQKEMEKLASRIPSRKTS